MVVMGDLYVYDPPLPANAKRAGFFVRFPRCQNKLNISTFRNLLDQYVLYDIFSLLFHWLIGVDSPPVID